MNRWITDRTPTYKEVPDHQMVWITEKGRVFFASGYYIRTHPISVSAWEPIPSASGSDEDLKATAEVVAEFKSVKG